MTKLKLAPDTVRLIRNLHPEIKRKIRSGLDAILKMPDCGKPLKEELSGLRSLRVGHYRIIYRAKGKTVIEIVTLGPRSRIYWDTLQLLKK